MITRAGIETAYCFLHQKERVYAHSTMDWQRDDIEYAISSFADDMILSCIPCWQTAVQTFCVRTPRFMPICSTLSTSLKRCSEQ